MRRSVRTRHSADYPANLTGHLPISVRIMRRRVTGAEQVSRQPFGGCRPCRLTSWAMPARRLDSQRLLAAVNAQRAALGQGDLDGPATISALGAACAASVIAAVDAEVEPQREALRG